MDLQQSLNAAVSSINARRFQEAINLCERSLLEFPNNVACLNLQAIALRGLGEFRKSIEIHTRILDQFPNSRDTLFQLGETFLQSHQYVEASKCFQKATKIDPGFAAAWSHLGYVQTLQKSPSAAIQSLQTALQLEPQNPDILNRLGVAFRNARQVDLAIETYSRALQIRPDFPQALNNLGAALQLRNRAEEALAAYAKAIQLQPDYFAVWNNLGALFQSQNKLPEAIQAYQTALSIEPKYFQAHVNEGHARLLLGDFSLGWLKHEYRWLALRQNPQRTFSAPIWRGEDSLLGKTILIHSEQGVGDSIQFLRYAAPLTKLGATVFLEVQPSLTRLAQTATGVSQVFAYGKELPNFDFHCPLLSLPLAFKTSLETIPNQTPYLSVPDDSLKKWAAILPKSQKTKIGIAWRGNPEHENDANRSISCETFLPLLNVSSCEFINLQIELSAKESELLGAFSNWTNPADSVADYSDSAALIAQLDLVISVDTSVAHLAGAMGKPVWILLPFAPDWRWMLQRTDSPWYPSARLFRQSAPQTWPVVIQEVVNQLRVLHEFSTASTSSPDDIRAEPLQNKTLPGR